MLLKNAELSIVKRSISVKPTTSLLEAREKMFRHKIKRLVVLGTKEKPVGIITDPIPEEAFIALDRFSDWSNPFEETPNQTA